MTDLAQEVVGRTLTQSHLAAWNLGMRRFGITDDLPQLRGLLVGEAPGPNTDPLMPLFPSPNSAGSRLLRYAGVPVSDWLGKLARMNLCDGTWSARRALAGYARALAFLFDEVNFYDGEPLRVLLLGMRVASVWRCRGSFGYTEHQHNGSFIHAEHQYELNPIITSHTVPSDKTLRVTWIPHPSGRDSFYKSRRNQLRARRAVLWAIGERDIP